MSMMSGFNRKEETVLQEKRLVIICVGSAKVGFRVVFVSATGKGS